MVDHTTVQQLAVSGPRGLVTIICFIANPILQGLLAADELRMPAKLALSTFSGDQVVCQVGLPVILLQDIISCAEPETLIHDLRSDSDNFKRI